MSPIEYMTTEELLKELKKRFDELLFVGYNSKTKGEDSYKIAVKATLHGSFGLIEILSRAADAQVEE